MWTFEKKKSIFSTHFSKLYFLQILIVNTFLSTNNKFHYSVIYNFHIYDDLKQRFELLKFIKY